MFYQMVFTGSVRSDVSKFVEQDSIELIIKRSRSLDVGGCMFYADGNYLIILEGLKENIAAMYDGFSSHPSLSIPLILLENPIEQRCFEDFSLSFQAGDMEEPIDNPILLNKSTPETLLPKQCPKDIRLFVDSFLKVQQVA